MDFDEEDVSGSDCRRLEAEEGEVDDGMVMTDCDQGPEGEEVEEEEEEEEEAAQEQWRLHSTALAWKNQTFASMDVDLEARTEQTSSPESNSTPQTIRNESPSVATPGSGDRPSSNSSDVESQEKRFADLQMLLTEIDRMDLKARMDVLRSLTAAARSGHASLLESRALVLALLEAQEMEKVELLGVMKGNKRPSPKQENGSTPIGSRLPAPGLTDLSAC